MGNPAEHTPSKIDQLHVLPAPEGGWVVKKRGEPSPLEHFDSKNAAEQYAYSQTVREAVVVHTPDEWLYTLEADGKIMRLAHSAQAEPTFGSARGRISISEDFDEPLPDFSEYMY